MVNEKLIRASEARKAILDADPKLAYCIDNIKAVDAVEVVHGRWVNKTADYVYYYACSECGEPVLKSQWGNDFFSDYCPNCGAKMDGGNEDG